MEKTRKKLYPELPSEETTPNVASICQYSSTPNPNQPGSPSPTQTCPIQKHYVNFLEDYIDKTDEILDKFAEIKKQAASHHYNSNCAKVSSTVVSGTGVALVMGSLWWAPLTAGSSLVLGAGELNPLQKVHFNFLKISKCRWRSYVSNWQFDSHTN